MPHDHQRSDAASRLVEAPPETIYRAFESATSLMKWLPPEGMSGKALEYEFVEGGRYRIELRYEEAQPGGAGKTTDRSDITHGRFLELLAGRRIKQSVEFETSDPAFEGTMTMTWTFEPAQGGTMVTVTADNVPRSISSADHVAGLKSSIQNLATFVQPIAKG